MVAFEDDAVSAGQRTGYRLGIIQGTRETLLGDVWLTIPRKLSFSLGGTQPNPSGGVPSVVFTLEDGRPATLGLYDLAGRRVAAREVGSLGSGTHVIRLSGDRGPLAPGVYTLLLTRDSERRSATTVVLQGEGR
jgi:hypothetical protein